MIRQAAAAYAYSPYCGAPPSPDILAGRWNLDPTLITALAVLLLAYWRLSAPRAGGAAISRWRRLAFVGGWMVASLALISPLCALSVSLFAARAAQHMILSSLAAPLVALGRPAILVTALGGRPARACQPLVSALVFVGALWFWHAPEPYRATFESDLAYWLMHVSIFGAALWLWTDLFEAQGNLAGLAASAGVTTAQMAILGAAITFAGHPLYSPHLTTTAAWGLTPIEDQQLGGVIMWTPAGLVFAIGLVLLFAGLLERTRTGALKRAVAA